VAFHEPRATECGTGRTHHVAGASRLIRLIENLD
jgi:hypothetical protein